MSTLRQRTPYSFDTDDTEDTRVLDEQEQEELIKSLRIQNDESNALYLRVLQITLSLSCFLHLVYLASPTKDSPLSVFAPTLLPRPLPLATLFTLLHIMIHLNLLLVSWSGRPILKGGKPLPYLLIYPASAVAPVLCIFLGLGMANLAWWSVAPAMILLHDTVHRWMIQGEESIAELERLKYNAKGA